MPLNFIVIFSTMSIFLLRTSMANRNNKNEHQLTLNFVRLRLVFYCVLMLHREDSTFQKLIGLFNMTLQMILMIISIELEELVEEQPVVEKLFYS